MSHVILGFLVGILIIVTQIAVFKVGYRAGRADAMQWVWDAAIEHHPVFDGGSVVYYVRTGDHGYSAFAFQSPTENPDANPVNSRI